MTVGDRPVVSALIFDENGNPLDLSGGLLVEPIWSQIARGAVSGAAGHNGGYVGTSSTSTVFVRGSTWADPGSAGQVEFLSSSGQDGATGHQGTERLRFVYYDGSGNGPFSEDIDMNGTNEVSSVATDVRFLEKIYSLDVGSNGTNVGTITCRVQGGGSTLGQIPAGDGKTFWAQHFVGAGRTCFITEINAGFTSTAGLVNAQLIPRTLDLLGTFDEGPFETGLGASLVLGNAGGHCFRFSTMVITGPQLFVLRVRPDASSAATTFANITYYDV